MLIELRAADDRLRGPKAVDAAPILTAALKAATDSPVDLSRLRVVCDFIQYRQNFRAPVVLRRVHPWAIDAGPPKDDGESWEIAIDLRRAKPDTVAAAIISSLERATAGKEPPSHDPSGEVLSSSPVAPRRDPSGEVSSSSPVAPGRDPSGEVSSSPLKPRGDPSGEVSSSSPVAPRRDPSGEVSSSPLKPRENPSGEVSSSPLKPRGDPSGEVSSSSPVASGRDPSGEVSSSSPLKPRRDPSGEVSSSSPVAPRGDPSGDDCARVALEAWGPGRRSLIWGFNSLYWKALSLWEQATGKGYESALPGGESDARNVEAARDPILKLFALWDSLAARRALPEELYVLELGVGNGNQARVFLDELRRLDRERGRGDYYRRLHYLMGDYSPHVLELARKNVAHHAENVSSLVLDAIRPSETLGFLRYKAFLVYISNVYDNLPTDEIVRIGGHMFQVETRAFLAQADAERLAASVSARPEELPDLIARLLRLGPELLSEVLPKHFPTPADSVAFWRTAWDGLRLDERYVPMVELDTYEIAPEVGGELLRPIALAAGDLRMHISNGAAASFADTLQLLHPHGVLQCHDLFVTDVRQYLNGFRGPGKYDGSVVNWVNGRLLAAIGSRRGFDVTFAPFAHRTGANVLTMTAHARD